MKTNTVLCLLMLGTAASYGQQPLTYIDSSLDTTGATRHTEIKTALDELLKKAESQLQKLDDQLTRTGDYLADNRASVTAAQTAMQEASQIGEGAKTNAQLAADRAKMDGKDVFDGTKDIDGVFTAVSETYTGKVRNDKGEWVEQDNLKRDPELYKLEAKMLGDLREFYRIRDEAVTKQKALEAARNDALEDLLETEDEVETARLSTLISSIDSELIAVRQDVANASDEVAMHEKGMQLQTIVESKSKQEEMGRKGTSAADIEKMVKDMLDKSKARTKEEKKRGSLPRFGEK
jgi:hypothetical protein